MATTTPNITNLMDVVKSVMNSSSTKTTSSPTQNTPTTKPPPHNLVNYGDLYKSPLEMNTWSKYLIADYANALIVGNSPVYKNSPTVLPGNRYFLDTNSQCKDASNNVHDRSVVIDNVLQTLVDDSNTSGNNGLMYSFFASLESLDKPLPPTPTYSPTAYLSDVSGQSNIPLCVPVSIYLDGSNTTNASGWITDTDRAELDPLALKEGFDLGIVQSVKPRDTIGMMNNTLSSYANHVQTVGAQSSSQLSQVQSNSSSKLQAGGIQANAVGMQDTSTLQSETSAARASRIKTVGSQMAQVRTQQQQQYRAAYDASYNTMPIVDLFQTFVTYASPTRSTRTPAKMINIFEMQPATEVYVRISGDCFNYVFNQIPAPANSPNLFQGSRCVFSNYPDIQVGDFIANLQQQAKQSIGNANVTLSLPTQYIPSKSVCEIVRSQSSQPVQSYFTGQTEYIYTYNQTTVPFDKNYNAFANALEPYRPYIINAFLSLDYPNIFDPCPPAPAQNTTPPAFLQDAFTVMNDQTVSIVKPIAGQNIYLYLALFLLLLLICALF